MEASQQTHKFCYTREQFLALRDSDLVRGNSDRFKIKDSIISKNPASRGRRKRKFFCIRPHFVAVPSRTQDGQGDTPTTPSEVEPPAPPVDTNGNKDAWRRAAGTAASCLLPGHTESVEYTAPLSTRHDSGSSGPEETVVRPGGKEVDWTLGCGKWRHRSKSGSERGSRPLFGGVRGRGRGDMSDGIPFTGGRGRGFVRRPYQPHNARGKGFKSHNGYLQPESMDDFWQEGDWKHGAPVGPPFFAHHAQRPGDFDDVFTHPSLTFHRQTAVREQGSTQIMSPPGLPADQPPADSASPGAPGTPNPASPSAPVSVGVPTAQTMWYYLDSEGQPQGPFDDATMTNWFIAGHLPITLKVRRQCDGVFSPLSDFLARLGRFPFVDSHKLPPILEPNAPLPQFPPAMVSLHSPPPPPPLPPQQQSLSPPPPPPTATPDAPALCPEPQLAIPAAFQEVPPELQPKSPEAFDRPVLTFGDLSFITEATLSEVKRLQENAKILTERASALGCGNSNLAKHLESLTLNASEVVLESPSVTKSTEESPLSMEPSSELDQGMEMVSETKKPCQSTMEADPPAKQQVHLTVPSEVLLTENAAPISEAPQQPLDSSADPVAVKKSRKSRKKTKQNDISAEQTTDVLLAEPSKTNTSPEPPPSVLTAEEILPEADWDTTSDAVDTSTRPTVAEQESSSSKKPKKKRKSKPTAEELRQKAWAQEEERRRQAAAERLAALDAEAARLAEERRMAELAYQAEAKKKEQAARQAALKAQKQRDAEYTAAMSSMAGFSLPAAAKWGSAAGKPVSNAPQPTPMTTILAEQTAEVLKANKGQAGGGTFAQKVAVSPHDASTAKGQSANKKKTKASPLSVTSNPSVATNKGMAVTSQSKTNPRTDGQSSQKPLPQAPRSLNSPAIASPKKSPLSIWDLPPDSSAVIGPSKKNSKKKKNNAHSQLLTGSAITLKPAARTELTNWCESQLSVFPQHDVDLPTLIALLCDIEEADDVLECIEASFGKSARLSKFSKAFVEKRATLMRLTA
ncbi:GRB10 interacting GYF protein 1 [Sparganum proliferum]